MKDVCTILMWLLVILMQITILTKINYLETYVSDIEQQFGTTIGFNSIEDGDSSIDET